MQPYYSDSQITLYNARCEEVIPQLEVFDLLLTDPPYGIGYGGKRNAVGGTIARMRSGWRTWKTDWDDEKLPQWLIDMCLSKATEAVIWGGNYYSLPPSMCWLVWNKEVRGFSLADAELAWTSLDKAVRIFDMHRSKSVKDGRVHPTQKPLALMRWCLGFFPKAKTILDPFAGAGTSLLAAKLEQKTAVGVEMSERYCELAARRLEQRVMF